MTADWFDALGDDELFDLLGPDWSQMTPAERARYGRAPAEPDALFTALERLGAPDDLADTLDAETADLMDRIEKHLQALETRVGLALYRERSAQSASHGPPWWQAAP